MFALFRLIKAGYVLMRYGIFSQLLENLPNSPALLRFLSKILAKNNKTAKDSMVAAIDKLGPSYIKLAQFLATRQDVVGAELSERLSLLQDRLPPFDRKIALAQIAQSLNWSMEEVERHFVDFPEAIAAASMAQVHHVIWKNENNEQIELAIKVVRPNVKERFQRDLKSFYSFARLQERISAEARRLRLVNVVEELEHATYREMDMRLEAAAISEMADNCKLDKNFRVPKIYWPLTGRNVLAMEWIDGIKIADKEALIAAGYNLKAISRNLMQSFLRHALRDGYFHADMHPGNLFIDKKGDIVAIDFGIVGRLGRKERFFLADILYGFINRDYIKVAKAHFSAGYVPKHHSIEDFAQANRAIGEPIHGKDAKNISMSKLLSLLFEVTEIFDMQTRPELIMLQKTMVNVEGLARDLDPEFNMWQAAKPVVEEWVDDNMSPKAIVNDVINTSKDIAAIVGEIPSMLQHWHQEKMLSAEHLEQRLNNIIPTHNLSIIRLFKFICFLLTAILLILLYLAFKNLH